jgi:hypothetical protein
MTYEELYDEYMSDNTAYCCYCGTVQHSFSCCGEVHFETFAETCKETQQEIIYNDDRLQTVS